jgi:hypothetical protein
MTSQISSHPNPTLQLCATPMPPSQFDLGMISSTALKHQISFSFCLLILTLKKQEHFMGYDMVTANFHLLANVISKSYTTVMLVF